MSRPPKTTAEGDRFIRATVIVVVCLVSLTAFYVSYSHGFDLAYDNGERNRAWAYPLTVDGLILSASMVILRANRHNIRPPFAAWAALCTGVAGSLYANVMHGVPHGVVGVLVSTWPAIALVLSFEMLMRLFRPAQRTVQPPRVQVPGEPPAVLPVRTPRAPVQPDPVPKVDPLAEPAPVPLLKAVPDPVQAGTDADRYTTGVRLYLASVQAGNPLSQTALARELGLKNRKLAARIIKEVTDGVHDGVSASEAAH